MSRSPALIYVAVGALIAEVIVWAVLLPWAHYRYATGISLGLGMWKAVVLLALAGGAQGLGTFAVRRALSGR
jgi:hypothetical protein